MPIPVTLAKPGTIDRPDTEHAKNYFAHKPRNPPQMYAPQIVAKTFCIAPNIPYETPLREAAGK
jgi:hypothetical protein